MDTVDNNSQDEIEIYVAIYKLNSLVNNAGWS